LFLERTSLKLFFLMISLSVFLNRSEEKMKSMHFPSSLCIVLFCAAFAHSAQSAETVFQRAGTTGAVELSNIDETANSQTPVAVDAAKAQEKSEPAADTTAQENPEPAAAPLDQENKDTAKKSKDAEPKARTDEEIAVVMQKYRETMVQGATTNPLGGSSANSKRYLMVDKNTFIKKLNN
jgi:hypothetical protein